MSIYIFSGAVHSGKSTELLKWCNERENIMGILMPDILGYRKIFNVKSKEIFDIQCTDATKTKELLITIGKFNFYAAAFEKANLILVNALLEKPDWLLIDEIGYLELDGKGFYHSMMKAAEFYNDDTSPGNLLITVRDSLYEEVISFFELKNSKVIFHLENLN